MNNLKNFEYLVGDKNINKASTEQYNEITCGFLGELSKELNLSAESQTYPDIKTFSFLIRKKNIYNLKKKIFI